MVALTVSLLIWAANLIGAIPANSTYADPILPAVIAILSSVALINGLVSTKFYEASRKLRLGRVSVVVIVSQLVALLSMLAWVSVDRSIWALVAGGISSSIAQAFLSHVSLAGPNNRWQWDGEAVREIVRFGRWMFLSSILGFLVNNGNRLLLGGMLDAGALGIYSIAFLLFGAVEQVMTTVIGEIMFPALSEIARERRNELKASYYRIQVFIASLSYGSAGVLIVGGQTIVDFLYDQRYRPAGWMLEVLAIGLLAVPWRSGALCFLALGLPQIISYSAAVRLVTLILTVPLGFHLFGFTGALCGIVLAQLATVPVILTYMARRGLLDVRKELLLLLVLPASVLVAKLAGMTVGTAGSAAVSKWVRTVADMAHLRAYPQAHPN
jgi:O-antigen/teichoic acid export membrane protein